MPECVGIYITRVYGTFACDRFFPEIDQNRFIEVESSDVDNNLQTENNITYRFHLLLDRKYLSVDQSIEFEHKKDADDGGEDEISR